MGRGFGSTRDTCTPDAGGARSRTRSVKPLGLLASVIRACSNVAPHPLPVAAFEEASASVPHRVRSRMGAAASGVAAPEIRGVAPTRIRGLALTCMAAWGVMAFGAMTVASTSAQAYVAHPFVGSFGPGGPGSATTFGAVLSVAVDQPTGDIYVYEAGGEGAGSVYKFNSAGEPVSFSGLEGTAHPNRIEGVGISGRYESELAVDNSTGPDAGDIYAANNEEVRIYGANGLLIEELSGGEACGVAVDPSGAVYVGFYPGTVRRYVPVANPVTNADETASMGGLNRICNIAVDGSGDVYAATYTGGVSKYEALQFGSMAAAGTLVDPQGSALAVDPSSSDVYVDEGSDIAQYDSSGSLLGISGATGPGKLGGGSFGVAVNGTTGKSASGDLYASDYKDGLVNIYGPAVKVAEASTEAPTGVSHNAATLHGTVNPNEILVSSCQFEYGTEEGVLPYKAACSPAPGSGGAPVAVSTELSGLLTSTTYHYRLAVTNVGGTSYGAEELLTTPPAVDALNTGPVEDVTSNGATLTGSLSPDGIDAHYYFQYGTSVSYGSFSPALPGTDAGVGGSKCLPPGGVGCSAVFAETTTPNLPANTTYHYRLVAVNAYGTTDGEDRTFTTFGPPAVLGESAEVNPTNKVGQTGATLGAQVNPDGRETTYQFEYGETSSYGKSTPLPPAAVGSGVEPVSVPTTELTNLKVGTTYHYRVSASNEYGTTDGPDQKFTTLPPSLIDEEFVLNVAATSATLGARINPLGNKTSYYFEYGTVSLHS